LIKVYYVLLDVGDEIFLEQNTELLTILLKDLLTVAEVKKYLPYFSTLIFYDKQTEENGGGDKG